MDPNEALRRLRQLTFKVLTTYGEDADPEAMELAEVCEGLDTWLTNGGFLPRDWKRKETK